MSIAANSSAHRSGASSHRLGWLAAMLVIAILAGWLLHRMEAGFLASLSEADNVQRSELLLSATLEDIISEDRPRLETMVDQFQENNPSFHSFSVTNEDGQRLLDWRRTAMSEPRKFLMLFSRVYPVQRSVVPIELEGERYGTIVVEWDQSSVGVRHDNHAFATAAGISILCLLFYFVGYRVARRQA